MDKLPFVKTRSHFRDAVRGFVHVVDQPGRGRQMSTVLKAAGVADRLWSQEDVIARNDADAPAPTRGGLTRSGRRDRSNPKGSDMTLHTVGPADMSEDEVKIGKAYHIWLGPVYMLAPFAIAVYAPDIKWLVAYGIAALTVNAHEAGGRLHDLCIRLRRTNSILRG